MKAVCLCREAERKQGLYGSTPADLIARRVPNVVGSISCDPTPQRGWLVLMSTVVCCVRLSLIVQACSRQLHRLVLYLRRVVLD